MTERLSFIFAGGGTGGHLFPGIAVAEELQRQLPSPRIVFIGSERSTEEQIIQRYEFEHHALPTVTTSSFSKHPFAFCKNNLQAFWTADRILKAEQPQAVIGLGGFASVPVILAAARQRCQTVLLEQNAIPGRATRWLRRYTNQICLTFPESVRYLSSGKNLYVTGNPLRDSIAELHLQRIDAAHQSVPAPHFDTIATQQKTLLILGGSQGAHAINQAIIELLPALRAELRDWRIVHQTGHQDFGWVRQQYQRSNINARVEPFLDDLDVVYRSAKLAVTRAGATTLAELACVGCPAIVIPYPHARDDHQMANARSFAQRGACRVVEQSEQITQKLRAELQTLLVDSQQHRDMQRNLFKLARPHAASEVCRLLCERAA